MEGQRAASDGETAANGRHSFPWRLRRLMWGLCLNGALLGLEALLQRISGTNKLLWLVEPNIIKGADGQFGPYAYRSNAAQYFNLLWPACLGFWWVLHRRALHHRPGQAKGLSRAYGVALPCALLMAACAIVSLSRGGAIIAGSQMLGAAVLWALARRRRGGAQVFALLACLVAAAGLAVMLEWSELAQRFSTVLTDRMSGRLDTYGLAMRMARDFPLYGSGPNTFAPVLGFYLSDTGDWLAQLHNDWLEIFITFGGLGTFLLVAALATAFGHYSAKGGFGVGRPFFALTWLGLAGCIVHGIFDFPLQIPSVLLLFLVLCAAASCLSRRRDHVAAG